MENTNLFNLDLKDEYLALAEFAGANKRLTHKQFEEDVLTSLNLFVIPKDEHFRALESSLDKIIRALPALKRIFSKPITRLKDVLNILPVESVRVINNQSMSHVSRHSELWGDISEDELKPKKLMTLDKEENYAIYENVVFSRLIKTILSFVKRSVGLLKDIIFEHKDLRINLLERTNHKNYFLAIGKLHMGYVRAQDNNTHSYEGCLNKLMFIDNVIHSKLNSPVYRICKKNTAKLTLKKSNIFRNQKDYKTVYNLMKWFNQGKDEINENFFLSDITNDGYSTYCNMITVFAMSHFNFEFDKKKLLNFDKIGATFEQGGWKGELKSVEHKSIRGIRITIKKEESRSVCLLHCAKGINKQEIEELKGRFRADEYLVCSPIDYDAEGVVYLNIYDIDSFRRIQQILLKQMVEVDYIRDVCPFCGGSLEKRESMHICPSCKMTIQDARCPITGEDYVVTGIDNFDKIKLRYDEYNAQEKFLFDKFQEGQMFYRNVTKLTPAGKAICPHCGEVH